MLLRGTRYAITCPGQGLVQPGLLRPFVRYNIDRHLDAIDAAVGFNLSRHMLDANDSAYLLDTANAQPAIVAATWVTAQVLEQHHGPVVGGASYLCGHSLGEYLAMLLSGVVSLETALRTVRLRGELMATLAGFGWGMKALLFKPAHFDGVVAECERLRCLANVNLASQVVILGRLPYLDHCIGELNRDGRRILKVVDLPVLVPFHNDILEPLLEQIESFLVGSAIQEQHVPMISNVNAEVLADAATTVRNAIRGTSRPVRWTDTIATLEARGVDTVLNLGPGTVLQGLGAKRRFRQVALDTPESFAQLEQL